MKFTPNKVPFSAPQTRTGSNRLGKDGVYMAGVSLGSRPSDVFDHPAY